MQAGGARGVWSLLSQRRTRGFLREAKFAVRLIQHFNFKHVCFLALGLIPTHHWYSLLKANSSRKHSGSAEKCLPYWLPYIFKRRHLTQENAPPVVASWGHMGLSASLRLFVMPALAAITNLIYSACRCEHTHLWAACKTDSCKGSISVWWFYFSVFLRAKSKCCKKCEMRSHFPPGSIICCMLRHDIVSLLNTSRLVFSRVSLTKYKSYHLHRCTVPHSQPTITFLFIVFSNEILAAVLYM